MYIIIIIIMRKTKPKEAKEAAKKSKKISFVSTKFYVVILVSRLRFSGPKSLMMGTSSVILV